MFNRLQPVANVRGAALSALVERIADKIAEGLMAGKSTEELRELLANVRLTRMRGGSHSGSKPELN